MLRCLESRLVCIQPWLGGVLSLFLLLMYNECFHLQKYTLHAMVWIDINF